MVKIVSEYCDEHFTEVYSITSRFFVVVVAIRGRERERAGE